MLTVVMGIMLTGALVANFYTTSAALRQQNMESLLRAAEYSALEGYQHDESQGIALPYFTLEVGRTGTIYAVWDGYYNLSQDLVKEITSTVLRSAADMGEIGTLNLYYIRQETDMGWRITCTDRSIETRVQKDLISGSVLLGAGGLTIFFFLSVLLANLIVDPVKKAWEQQQLFVSDASHELKTPLTVILSSAEMLQSGAGDEPSRRRWLDNIHAEGERMRRLVEDMLMLSRTPESRATEVPTDVDFSQLVDSCVLTFEPTAFERGILFESDIRQGCHVRGSGDKLHQLVSILLDNAVKYCATGGTVDVTLHTEGTKSVLLRVKNPGTPLNAQEREAMFHRFYRTDESRGQRPGYGLGLAIARDITTAMRGKIWTECVGQEIELLVRLPLQKH